MPILYAKSKNFDIFAGMVARPSADHGAHSSLTIALRRCGMAVA
jgi:hypothetical protein